MLFSSHILEEVEQVARQIEVVVSGRHAASGDFGEIRRLMTDRPVQYVVVSDDDRRLASALIAEPSVVAVSLRPHSAVGAASTCRCPTSAGSRCGCPGSRATPACACSSWPRPTSRWRASSPTWWGGDGPR